MSVEAFKTVAGSARIEIPKIKGSRFIGEVYPVSDAEDALGKVTEVRKREHAARHCCFAYRLHPDASDFRSSDDGEPSGSAGRPILNEIEGRQLTDTLVIVTRYFGGTKLGVGGLVRAYSSAAKEVLARTVVVERIRKKRLVLQFSYDLVSAVERIISQAEADVRERRYGESVEFKVDVGVAEAERLIMSLTDRSSGGVVVRSGEGDGSEEFYSN